MVNPNSYFKITEKLKFLEEHKDHSRYWNIDWNQGEKLAELIKEKNPNNILEIGTSNGFSTLWLALNSNGNITTIDVDPGRLGEARQNFEACDLTIETICGEIFEVFEETEFEPIDFVFLDAAHKKYREIIEILENRKMLAEGVIIVCDNVISHSYMNEFVSWMKFKYDCEVLEIGGGFLIARS